MASGSGSDLSVGVIVNYRDPEQGLLERCVESLEQQEYQNWRAYLCDDASRIGVTIEGHRINHRRNPIRLGMVANSIYSICQSHEDIILHVDGDDALYPLALNYVVETHARGADMTWGSCESSPFTGARVRSFAKAYAGDLREFSVPAPRSYRRSLFMEAWEKWGWSAFTHRSGRQWPHAGDIAVIYPLLRIARDPRPISEIIYWINRHGPSHDRQRSIVRKAIIHQAEALS